MKKTFDRGLGLCWVEFGEKKKWKDVLAVLLAAHLIVSGGSNTYISVWIA